MKPFQSFIFGLEMRIYHTILSIVLAAAVLVAGIGVTINFHLCAGKVRSVAINVKADGCHDEQSCHAMHAEKRRGCCAEKTFVLKAKESTASVKSLFTSKPPVTFVIAALPVLSEVIVAPGVCINSWRYAFYKPPLLHRTSQAFLQAFLI